jgi:hypothetical protein
MVTPGLRSQNQVQQLNIWTPGDLNLHIFALYSPPIALLWHMMTSSNWWPLLIALGCLVTQTQFLISTYSTLVKDRSVISAEVLHEYDTKFVYPRVFAPKRDMGTSTNEAEFVSWREDRRQSSLYRAGVPSSDRFDAMQVDTPPRACHTTPSRWINGSPFLEPSPSMSSLRKTHKSDAAKELKKRRETFFS